MARTLVLLGFLTTSIATAGDLTPYQAEEVKPARPADEPRIFQADDVKPTPAAEEPRVFQAETPEVDRGVDAQPSRGGSVQPSGNSSDIELFHAEPAKRAPKPGVDPVLNPRPMPRELAGSWKLVVPSSSTTHRLLDGPNVIDRTTSTVGAPMGTLRITPDGRFTFTRAGTQVASGKVEEVLPRQGADANGRYFRVRDETEEFYVNVTAGKLTLFSVAGNSFVANGTR